MSYNGSGTFQINTSGQPVVAGTVISSTAFNALTADLATGLSTAITKDGQTTTTARIPFAAGINSSSATDSTSTATGSIITAGGVGIAKALFVGTTANVAGAVTLQSTLGVTGVATFSAAPIYSSLTASSAVATDASKALVSVTNTGTGNNVLATSPTITTPTISSLSSAAATALTLQSAGTTAITIDTSQKVGIGTASPSAPLHVQAITGGVAMRLQGRASPADGYSDISFYNNANTVSFASLGTSNSGMFFGTNTAIPLAFYTNSAEVGRFDSSGNLLVGTTSSTAKFTLKGSGAGASTTSIYTSNSAAAYTFVVNDDGTIYTGATPAGAPYNFTTASAANVFVGSSGALQRSTSSLKYKTDVQDATHGLADALKLRAVTYKGKNDGEKIFGGLIAEEVHEAGLTEFVQYAEDGSPDALAYGNMISLCIKAIQEMKALVDTQASTIQSLTTRITALEQK